MASSKEKVDVKVVFLGDSAVGKSCLLVRFLDNSFGETTSTIGASFFKKAVAHNGVNYSLGLWDTAGQERYDSLSSFYCRGAGAACICYDLTDRQSFDHLQKWVDKLYTSNPDPECFIVLIGTKLDLIEEGTRPRCASLSTVESFLAKHDIDLYLETSSRTGKNVSQVFEKIAEKLAELSAKGKGPRTGGAAAGGGGAAGGQARLSDLSAPGRPAGGSGGCACGGG